jgi:A/G-specific adenine glycosylase
MLGNLWEYPGGSLPEGTPDLPGALTTLLAERFGLWIAVEAQVGVFKHAYTHFRITLHAFACQLPDANKIPLPPGFAWVKIAELSKFPMGKVARLISRELAF